MEANLSLAAAAATAGLPFEVLGTKIIAIMTQTIT
jgi:hypothetical protein